MSFKDKFHVNPQHDSEGFTMPDAKCVGCSPADMCPRSGHCERYDSPLRHFNELLAQMPTYEEMGITDTMLANAHLDGINPKGWQEVDGVKLPPITWAQPTRLADIAAMSDEMLEAMFQHWLHSSTKPEARKVEQRQEITAMLQRFNAQGVQPLSDSRAPDVFVGRR